MSTTAKIFGLALVMAGAHGTRALGQANTGTTLQIDVENVVQYIQDVADVSKLASESNATPAVAGKNFRPFLVLGDIVAINGRPAKGTVAFHARQITLASAPTGGQGIADVVRGNANEQTFEIQRADGTPVGSIMAAGLGAGTAPPGSPLATAQGNNAIFGGTGAFLGVRGQAGRAVTPQDVPDRQASMAEDPANRRKNGGGKERFVLHIVPMSIPAIVNTPQGPAITHSSDFAVVTTAKPAAPGEILSLFATGLGPTHPGVEPGMPFPTGTLVDVNAPVEVTVNGTPAEVLSANGYPGGVNAYQLNFRIPSGTTPGTATIRLSAAWIAGGEAEIAIR